VLVVFGSQFCLCKLKPEMMVALLLLVRIDSCLFRRITFCVVQTRA